MRKCPACARRIQDAATKCHYCGAAAPHAPRPERVAAPVTPVTERRKPTETRAKALWLITIGLLLVLGAWWLGWLG